MDIFPDAVRVRRFCLSEEDAEETERDMVRASESS
jgi:hypothetical protein